MDFTKNYPIETVTTLAGEKADAVLLDKQGAWLAHQNPPRFVPLGNGVILVNVFSPVTYIPLKDENNNPVPAPRDWLDLVTG